MTAKENLFLKIEHYLNKKLSELEKNDIHQFVLNFKKPEQVDEKKKKKISKNPFNDLEIILNKKLNEFEEIRFTRFISEYKKESRC